jgi:hypothetical protein
MPAAEIGTAEIYRSAVQNLDAAERAYMAAVDALDRAGRDARTLERARRNCEDAEGALLRALDTAHTAHRSYWRGRRDELREELDQAAFVIAEFNAFARLAGDLTTNPAMQILQAAVITTPPAEPFVDDGVPTEAPDSAALEDFRGCWRRP